MKRSFFSSLRVRLMGFVLVALVPPLIVMLYSADEQKRLGRVDIREDLLRLTRLHAREEEQLLEGTRQILSALAQYVRMHKGDPRACSEYFAGILKDFARYANFGAVKADGALLCSAAPLSHSVRFADSRWFREVMATGAFTHSGFQEGGISDKPVLVFATPVLDAKGAVNEAVFAAIELSWLSRFDFYRDMLLPAGTTLTQIDDRGIVLSRQPGPQSWVGRPLPLPDLMNEVLQKKTGISVADNGEGISYLYAYEPVYEPVLKGGEIGEVYLILGKPKATAFALSRRLLIRSIVWLGLGAALALVVAWFAGDIFLLRRVRTLLTTTRRLTAGDLAARTGSSYREGELGELERAFDEMAATLQEKEGERARADEELRNSYRQLRDLSLYLQTAREEERTRIAREIHDELGQGLTALKMDLSWLKKRLLPDPQALHEKAASMEGLIDATIQIVQRLSGELRPGILDDLGLAAAMQWQAEEFRKRTGIPCGVRPGPDDISLDRGRSTAIFRIFQEALTNVARHAGATEVTASLEVSEASVVLKVQDNGRGIKPEEIASPTSFGLIGIRERVHFLGGQVDIMGVENKGTTITVTVPIGDR
jgi:signal transduction histidine kinase